MAPKKTTKKQSTLAEGREQVVLILDADVRQAIEDYADSVRLKRNAVIQLALIKYLTDNSAWPPKEQK